MLFRSHHHHFITFMFFLSVRKMFVFIARASACPCIQSAILSWKIRPSVHLSGCPSHSTVSKRTHISSNSSSSMISAVRVFQGKLSAGALNTRGWEKFAISTTFIHSLHDTHYSVISLQASRTLNIVTTRQRNSKLCDSGCVEA